MSSEKEGENPSGRKSKVSRGRFVRPGGGGTEAEAKERRRMENRLIFLYHYKLLERWSDAGRYVSWLTE